MLNGTGGSSVVRPIFMLVIGAGVIAGVIAGTSSAAEIHNTAALHTVALAAR